MFASPEVGRRANPTSLTLLRRPRFSRTGAAFLPHGAGSARKKGLLLLAAHHDRRAGADAARVGAGRDKALADQNARALQIEGECSRDQTSLRFAVRTLRREHDPR